MKLNGKEYIKKQSVSCTNCAFKNKPKCEKILNGSNDCLNFIFVEGEIIKGVAYEKKSATHFCSGCDLGKSECGNLSDDISCMKSIFKKVVEETCESELIRVKERFVDSCIECFFYRGQKCKLSMEFRNECYETHTIVVKGVKDKSETSNAADTKRSKDKSEKWGSW